MLPLKFCGEFWATIEFNSVGEGIVPEPIFVWIPPPDVEPPDVLFAMVTSLKLAFALSYK